jgi:hypothetical protein
MSDLGCFAAAGLGLLAFFGVYAASGEAIVSFLVAGVVSCLSAWLPAHLERRRKNTIAQQIHDDLKRR